MNQYCQNLSSMRSSFFPPDPDDSTQIKQQLVFQSNLQLCFICGIMHPFIGVSALESPNRISQAVLRNGQMRANAIVSIYLQLKKWNMLIYKCISNNQSYFKEKVLKSNFITDSYPHWVLNKTMFPLVPAVLFAVWLFYTAIITMVSEYPQQSLAFHSCSMPWLIHRKYIA